MIVKWPKVFLLPICLAVAAAAFFVFAETSEVFHDCIEHAQYKASQTPPYKQPSDISVSVGMHYHCRGNVVKKDADGIIAFFTIVLAGSAIGLWLSTNQLWRSAERELIATHRPWVKVDGLPVIASDLVFADGEGSIDLVFVLSNRGSAPGLRVRVDAKIVASNQINLLTEQKNWAAHFRADSTPSEIRPEYTSWKGDQIVYSVKAWMNSLEMPRFKPLSDNTPFPIRA